MERKVNRIFDKAKLDIEAKGKQEDVVIFETNDCNQEGKAVLAGTLISNLAEDNHISKLRAAFLAYRIARKMRYLD